MGTKEYLDMALAEAVLWFIPGASFVIERAADPTPAPGGAAQAPLAEEAAGEIAGLKDVKDNQRIKNQRGGDMTERKKNGRTPCGFMAGAGADSAQKAGHGTNEEQMDREKPDANVDPDGHCTVPDFAETARFDTGEPCLDGLNWPEAGDDVAVSAKDGAIEKRSGKNRKKS